MTETKTGFRTNQQEYSDLIEQDDEVIPAPENGKFIAVVAVGLLCAVMLATLLSVRI